MSYANMDGVPTQTAGTSELLASDWNTYVRDNFDSIKFGHVVCTSSTRPTGIAEGTMIYETDTNKVLVYNGSSWKEISDLDSTDGVPTSAQTKLDTIGLSHIKTETVGAGSGTVTINNCFSSTYSNYHFVIEHNSSASGAVMRYRLVVGGSANATANAYSSQNLTYALTTLSGTRTTADYGIWCNSTTNLHNMSSGVISKPFASTPTAGLFTTMRHTTNDALVNVVAFSHNQSTSYDGIQFFPESGTWSGVVRIYGYNNG